MAPFPSLWWSSRAVLRPCERLSAVVARRHYGLWDRPRPCVSASRTTRAKPAGGKCPAAAVMLTVAATAGVAAALPQQQVPQQQTAAHQQAAAAVPHRRTRLGGRWHHGQAPRHASHANEGGVSRVPCIGGELLRGSWRYAHSPQGARVRAYPPGSYTLGDGVGVGISRTRLRYCLAHYGHLCSRRRQFGHTVPRTGGKNRARGYQP